MSASDHQLNLRLNAELHGELEAAAFVHGSSVSKFASELLEEAIEAYAGLPTVRKALEAREEQLAIAQGKLVNLPQRKKR